VKKIALRMLTYSFLEKDFGVLLYVKNGNNNTLFLEHKKQLACCEPNYYIPIRKRFCGEQHFIARWHDRHCDTTKQIIV